MRTLEYIYLVAAVGLVVFLAMSYKEMESGPRIALMVGTGICAFMYSFRRAQRIKWEQLEREEALREEEADHLSEEPAEDDH